MYYKYVVVRMYWSLIICIPFGEPMGAQVSQATGGKGDRLMSEREPDNSLPPSDKTAGQNVMERIHRKSYSEAVIEGVRKRVRVFVGESIVRKTDRVLNKGDDMVVCLPGAKIQAITERVENIVGSGMGGSVLVHVGTNNIEREGTTAIVRKYRNLVRTLKQTRVEQVILSGILPVIGRGHRYRNCRGMAINMLVKKLCREEEVGFVDLWGSFVGRADMYMKDRLHLSGKGAAVFADGLSAAVDSGMGSISNIFGSKLFKLEAQGGYLEMPQAGQEVTSTDKPITEYPKNMSEAGYRCVCLNARSIVNKKTN